MRTLLKTGLIAATFAMLAVACSNDPPAKDPSATDSTPQKPFNDPAPQNPAMGTGGAGTATLGNPNPQSAALGTGGPQESTIGSGGPQAPFPDTKAKTVTTLTDGEIFAIETALNTGEVTLAQMAPKSASSASVKEFAAMMVTQHQEAQNKAKAIAQKAKIVANDDDVSNKLKSDASSVQSDLKGKKGADFDKAYIDSQVKMHKDGLDLVDNQLLPSAKNGELKDHLTQVRSHVAMHLSKAQDIQSKLGAVGTATSNEVDTSHHMDHPRDTPADHSDAKANAAKTNDAKATDAKTTH